MSILHGVSMDSTMTFVWLVAMVLLLAVEIATVNLTTICFALGMEKGMELIDSMPDIEAIFIDKENKVYQ